MKKLKAKAGVAVADPLPASHESMAHARPPQQQRSRQSFDRAIDAAVALMVERGSDAFTLAEVAQRADVSIGSIYGRVKSKDDLIRTVQVRELARIDRETEEAFERISTGVGIEEVVASSIRTTAEVLRSNAPVLSPFMLRANTDTVVAAAGKAIALGMVRRFTSGLLAHADEITHSDPEGAVGWTFTVVYAVIARYLGLGSNQEAAGEGDWDEMIANLIEMTTSFLTGHR